MVDEPKLYAFPNYRKLRSLRQHRTITVIHHFHPIWSVTSHQSAPSLDALISVWPPRACYLYLEHRLWQLLSRPLLHGTASRLIFVMLVSALWLSDVNLRIICLIHLVIHLFNSPRSTASCFYIISDCELLADFETLYFDLRDAGLSLMTFRSKFKNYLFKGYSSI